jgi:hypothetical protein
MRRAFTSSVENDEGQPPRVPFHARRFLLRDACCSDGTRDFSFTTHQHAQTKLKPSVKVEHLAHVTAASFSCSRHATCTALTDTDQTSESLFTLSPLRGYILPVKRHRGEPGHTSYRYMSLHSQKVTRHIVTLHSALTFLQFAMPMASAHADCCYSGLYAIDLGSWYFDGGVAPRPRSRVDRPLAPSWALGIPYSSTPPMLRLMTG